MTPIQQILCKNLEQILSRVFFANSYFILRLSSGKMCLPILNRFFFQIHANGLNHFWKLCLLIGAILIETLLICSNFHFKTLYYNLCRKLHKLKHYRHHFPKLTTESKTFVIKIVNLFVQMAPTLSTLLLIAMVTGVASAVARHQSTSRPSAATSTATASAARGSLGTPTMAVRKNTINNRAI